MNGIRRTVTRRMVAAEIETWSALRDQPLSGPRGEGKEPGQSLQVHQARRRLDGVGGGDVLAAAHAAPGVGGSVSPARTARRRRWISADILPLPVSYQLIACAEIPTRFASCSWLRPAIVRAILSDRPSNAARCFLEIIAPPACGHKLQRLWGSTSATLDSKDREGGLTVSWGGRSGGREKLRSRRAEQIFTHPENGFCGAAKHQGDDGHGKGFRILEGEP